MNYRFIHFSGIYSLFEKRLFPDNLDVTEYTYQQLYDILIQSRFGWSDYFTRYMKLLGNDAIGYCAGSEILQKAWAREYGYTISNDNNWQTEIVLEQVRSFRPDVVFLEDLSTFDIALRNRLRDVCTWPITIIGWRAAPTDDFSAFHDLDLMLSAAPHFVDEFRRLGIKAEFLALAFEHSILNEIQLPIERDLEFTFVGSLGAKNGVNSSRYIQIERLMQNTPLEVWAHTKELRRRDESFMARMKRWGKRQLFSFTVDNSFIQDFDISIKEQYPKRVHPAMFGLDAFKILGRSKMTFNCHIDVAGEYAGNMRLYESTGMGACLVTDLKKNLHELFDPDTEIVVYSTPDEAMEKVIYLLDHETKRKEIAAAGQKRTLRDHTYQNRVEQFHQIILRELRTK